MRKILFPSHQYKENENKRLFSACHALIEDLSRKGIPVIFNATNLLEHHREYYYRAAERAGAKLILVWVEAPVEVVRQHLLARKKQLCLNMTQRPIGKSIIIIKPRRQRISRNHLVIDTLQDITTAIDKIVRAIKR